MVSDTAVTNEAGQRSQQQSEKTAEAKDVLLQTVNALAKF
jgi:hypothetical protein